MDSSKNQTQQVPNPDEGKGSKIADNIKAAFQPHSANPGPVIPKDFNVAQEGTKEERMKKAEELNKK